MAEEKEIEVKKEKPKKEKKKKATNKEEVRFRDWFKIDGIREEIQKITWLTGKDLVKNSAVVLLFCFVLGLFFFGSDAVIAFILHALGMD
ncbi:MAG: preprotein translocase subunit SecE [Thomasclavelia sp.]|nr:preprotein translocase subunit SecE [Thomasclavelia sp.]